METISCACSRCKNSIWAHELKSLSPIQEGRSCSFILQERLAYCGVKKKQKKTPKNLAKRVLKRKIWKLSGRLSVFFSPVCAGNESHEGAWVKTVHTFCRLCHLGPGLVSSQLFYAHIQTQSKIYKVCTPATVRANFGKLLRHVLPRRGGASASERLRILPARVVKCLIDVLDGAVFFLGSILRLSKVLKACKATQAKHEPQRSRLVDFMN